MTARFVIEALTRVNRRDNFTRGTDRIDGYLRQNAMQDVQSDYARCYIARDIASDRVAEFYTLYSSNVLLNEVPETLANELPRYPTVPAVLIGWLARHTDYAGIGLGEALLFDAIRTVTLAPIGAHAIFVDAIDEPAAEFYASFGFTALIGRAQTLYLPVATARQLLD